MVSPVTIIGDVAPVPVSPPGLAVTVYPLIVAPPVFTGAVKAILACVSPAVAVAAVGAPATTAVTVKLRLT